MYICTYIIVSLSLMHINMRERERQPIVYNNINVYDM